MVTLEARQLTKCYLPSVPAVRDLSFCLTEGQVLGFVGPNRKGKSTTVKMLTGLLQPTQGRVLWCSAAIQRDMVQCRKRLGYVPEETDLYPFLSGWEYLELVGTLRGLPRKSLTAKIDALLEICSLASHRHSAVGSYSKGMRQRILLIASLLHDPSLLILDEPLSDLDVTSAMIVKNLIKTLAERGKAILYCSHVLELVEKVCSHIIVLRQGRTLASSHPAELMKSAGQSSLEHAFAHLIEGGDAAQAARDIAAVMSSV
jgi:ABC-2 type transport system ATP-binding protein